MNILILILICFLSFTALSTPRDNSISKTTEINVISITPTIKEFNDNSNRSIQGRQELELSGGYKVIDKTPTISESANSEEFFWPIEWTGVSSKWGPRKDPITGKMNSVHKGVDLPAKIGTLVKAPKGGVVRESSWNKSYGNYIIIDHDNDFSTRFGHLDSCLVTKGERVIKEQIIAKSGNTGRSTGPHLHFEIRRNEVDLNPLNFRKIK